MLIHILKITFKILWRRKFFTFICLFGIGFSLMILIVAASFYEHAFGLRPWDQKKARMLYVKTLLLKGDYSRYSGFPSFQFLDKYIKHLKTPEAVSLYSRKHKVPIFENNVKTSVALKYTDDTFWEMFEFVFDEGNHYGKRDLDKASKVAVISQKTKKELFGTASPLGKTIKIKNEQFKIIGVVNDVTEFFNEAYADVWLPHTTIANKYADFWFKGNFSAILLAASKKDLTKIKTEFRQTIKKVTFPPGSQFHTIEVPLLSKKSETISRLLNKKTSEIDESVFYFFVFGAILLFMLLPILNLINLNISRIAERSAEIGVRRAFGATKWHLLGQFVIENTVLTAMAGIVAFFASYFVLKLITLIGIFHFVDFSINTRVLLVGITLTLFFGILSGVYPAYRMAKQNPVESLTKPRA